MEGIISMKTSYIAKKQIAEAFHQVSHKKSINNITVTDVMHACNMTRQMFYHYFQDLDDLIMWIHRDITEQFANEFFDGISSMDSAARYMESMVEYRAFYKYILKKTGYNSFANSYFRLIEDYVVTYMRKYKRHTITEEEQFAIKLFWRGVTAMIVEWIENDMQEDPHVMSSRFHMCMPMILQKHLL